VAAAAAAAAAAAEIRQEVLVAKRWRMYIN
jgi:hypothetical protein